MGDQQTPIDGTKQINGRETSKRGYPIVEVGTPVECHHCGEVHIADNHEDGIGYDVPGGHKRHCHYLCPNTGKMFAARDGSKLR